MELAVGNIVTGKVTTITRFGAFVALPGGKSGLVHISEVAPAFVSDVQAKQGRLMANACVPLNAEQLTEIYKKSM